MNDMTDEEKAVCVEILKLAQPKLTHAQAEQQIAKQGAKYFRLFFG
jgi:hypothetical protein|tara:strand:+ start:723 stop:860 length:138 start_codon:yes stop_codon:yes gene_type:complete